MSFLEKLWAKVVNALGVFAGFIPGIAAAVKIAIEKGDVEKLNDHLDQLDEAADAIKAFVKKGKECIDDGTLDLIEGSELALEREKVVDELEDVVSGQDD